MHVDEGVKIVQIDAGNRWESMRSMDLYVSGSVLKEDHDFQIIEIVLSQ